MSSNYYLGTSPEFLLGGTPRYFYAIRRNADGELFFIRSDQLKDRDQIDLNSPGPIEENYEDFEVGVDFFEGIDENHEVEYENLMWPQYKWDSRSLLFYVNEQGQLVVSINQNYRYPEGISSNG